MICWRSSSRPFIASRSASDSMSGSTRCRLRPSNSSKSSKVNQYRFTFEDLLELEGRSLQRVLPDIESDALRLAMKGLDEERQQIIYSNMSERAAARLREE